MKEELNRNNIVGDEVYRPWGHGSELLFIHSFFPMIDKSHKDSHHLPSTNWINSLSRKVVDCLVRMLCIGERNQNEPLEVIW